MKLCGFDIGLDQPFFLIAGTCVIESEQMALDTAGTLKEITSALGIPFIYKSSFDKANRSSGTSFRGLGMEKGLEILAKVKQQIGVPVLTDIHEIDEIKPVAAVVDVLQTPAFLCRQTDFIRACAQSGKPVNIKKGQFLAPHDMVNVIAKARAAAKEVGLPEDNFMACAWRSCARLVRRWCLMPRTRYSCRVVKALLRAVNASLCPCWPAPRLLPVLPVSSWKPIPIRPKPSRMALMRCRWRA